MNKAIVGLVVLGVLSGCASRDTRQTVAADDEKKVTLPAAPPQKSSPMTMRGPDIIVKETPKAPAPAPVAAATPQPMMERRKGSIYFDYNRYEIKPEFRAVVTDHARQLAQSRAARVVVEGSADERGSREYNLALGQRRAQTVKQSLITLGAQRRQIDTVSYGEDRPRATGKDETSYAENRRADVVYQ